MGKVLHMLRSLGWLAILLLLLGRSAGHYVLTEPTASPRAATAAHLADESSEVPLATWQEGNAFEALVPLGLPLPVALLVCGLFVFCQALVRPLPTYAPVARANLSYFRNLFPHLISPQAP